MSQMSDYLEDAIRNWFKGTTFPAAPANVYVGLASAAPSDSSFGTELAYTNYARQAIAAAAWTSGAAGSGQISNTNAITFPAAGASGVPVTATHFFVADAVSAGNLLIWAALGASRTINQGDDARFAAGTLVITFA